MSTQSKFIVTMFSLLVLMILVIFTGAVSVNIGEIFDKSSLSLSKNIVWNIRFPRMVTAIAAGGGLAVSGLILQTWFKNQLADPFLLGVHSGTSLGVAIYVLGLSSFFSGITLLHDSSIIIFGLLGALSILLMMIYISSKFRGSIYIIIFGIVISFFITGIINLILSFSSADELKHFFLWSLGSFDRMSGSESVIVLLIIISLVMNLFIRSDSLNICLLGDDYARESGIELSLLRKIIIPTVGVISGLISVYCGPVIFIGLMGPHLTRMIFSTSNHRVLIPGSFLIGAGLCLVVTIFSSGYFAGMNIPVNALLGLVGTPFVLILLVNTSKRGQRGQYV